MNTRLFVGNLAYNATQEEFVNELASLSLLPKEVKVMTDRETGNGRGFAFVSFNSPEDAEKALMVISGYIFYGRPLRADYATEKPRTGAGSVSRPPAPSGPHPGSGNKDGGWQKQGGRPPAEGRGGGGGRSMGDWGDSDGGGRRGRRGRGDND